MTRRDRVQPAGELDLALAVPVFAVAALVRAVPIRTVLAPDGVLFRDGDSYSHMSRIWNAASMSIPMSTRDAFVNFPHGGEVPWSPAFDWILATLVGVLRLDQPAAEVLCAWVPLLLGAAAVSLAALIAARAFSLRAGWITGLMLGVLPGGSHYTQLGFLDHHAAITVLATAMLGGAMWIVADDGRGPRRWPAVAGATGAFVLLIWPGALLHLVVLQASMLIWALGASSRLLASARANRLAAAHAVIAIVILPFSLRTWEIYGDFSPLVLTRFQPIYFGAAAVCLFAVAMSWRAERFGATRLARLASTAALGITGLAAAFIAIPELAVTLDESAGWFTDDESFIVGIAEIAPLFSSAGNQPGWLRPIIMLSPLFLAFPIAIGAIVWRHRRREVWLLVFWAVAFCALTLSQTRFINTFTVAYSIVTGGAVACLLDVVAERAWTQPMRLAAQAFICAVVGTSLVIVSGPYYANQYQQGETDLPTIERHARIEVARFLANSRPPTLDENRVPTSALLCAWSGGHVMRYHSGWAVNQDGFGPYVSPENVGRAQRYFNAMDEDQAIEILEPMGTEYVVAEIMGAGQPPYPIDSMARRLVELPKPGGSYVDRASVPKRISGLGRHRVVFVAPSQRGGAWLYEIVPGAIVIGSAVPGSLVTLQARLIASSGQRLIWTARMDADETGQFRFRVPYATVDAPESGVTPEGPYRLRRRQGLSTIDVTEASIRNGATVMAPLVDKNSVDE
jgi:asparagine N-glycosylation enzyme membrane subunit Stt3